MDFTFDEEQQALRASVRDFLEKESTGEAVRRAAAGEDGWDEGVWQKATAQGWGGLTIPEEYGGVGLGTLEQAIVAEETGRRLFCGPLLSSYLGAAALLISGTDQQKSDYLPPIAAGTLVPAIALWEGRSLDPNSIQMKVRVSDGGFVLDGEKLFVVDGMRAGLFIVAVNDEDSRPAAGDSSSDIAFFLVDADAEGIERQELPSVDRTRRIAAVAFHDVEVPASSHLSAGPPRLAETLRDRAAVFLAAEQSGIARRCLELSVEHAKGREQFGKPIGTYQAVSHKLSDMFLYAEHAASLVYYGAWAADHESEKAPLGAWRAKVWCDQAARRAALDAIQVHGGIGFTWEHDLHMYLKRAKANATLFDEESVLLPLISLHAHG